jgi:hypothetical protein
MYNLHLFGRVAEWFNAPVLKTGVGASLPRVQIPALPPSMSTDKTKGAALRRLLFFNFAACELLICPHVQ